tara:strand:- start:1155 stop:1352 length:198 start_codon:yes stop_codon:yes gene_type:complete
MFIKFGDKTKQQEIDEKDINENIDEKDINENIDEKKGSISKSEDRRINILKSYKKFTQKKVITNK